jgi:PIN domain nuclease of toxin-antitoxin system
LPLPEPIEHYVPSRMILIKGQSLDIKTPHAIKAAALPLHHRDPFDRMLIAQAQVENMMLVSADRMFQQYDVLVLWAATS